MQLELTLREDLPLAILASGLGKSLYHSGCGLLRMNSSQDHVSVREKIVYPGGISGSHKYLTVLYRVAAQVLTAPAIVRHADANWQMSPRVILLHNAFLKSAQQTGRHNLKHATVGSYKWVLQASSAKRHAKHCVKKAACSTLHIAQSQQHR